MCLAFPGKIISIDKQQAVVDFDGVQKEVNISLITDAKKGDFIIIHAGFAIEKIDKNVKKEIDKLVG